MDTTLEIPHAIIFVMDNDSKDLLIPEYIKGQLTAANGACLSIGTQADVDGDVHITLSDELSQDKVAQCSKVFEGKITTPDKKLSVCLSDGTVILEQKVKNPDTNIEVWANDDYAPDKILIKAYS